MRRGLCSLIYGAAFHHIDHIAPLASLLGIPVFTTEPDITSLIEAFYPDTEVHYLASHALPPLIASHFEGVISTLPIPLCRQLFATEDRCPQFLWCPHGFSDKGQQAPFFEALKEETCILYYGPAMLQKLHNISKGCKLFCIGDYRWQYFCRHRTFYENKLAYLRDVKDTILYAPTWSDAEQRSSFVDTFPTLLAHLTRDFRLLVKLHPNEISQASAAVWKLCSDHEHHLVNDIPAIYPLLHLIDGYIGDRSSINYDFLRFQKPMYLLQAIHSPLTPCVPLWQGVFAKDHTSYFPERQKLYDTVFASSSDPHLLHEVL